ncbi:fibronectin type III domain-containing protein [Hymenobacter negativus]|nr:fibronectin type III domain-containing protein [Hymenobacter negativus]
MTSTTSLLATGTYRDDVASAVVPIGFDFGFMGKRYSEFSVNSNGQLRLGASLIAGTGYTAPVAGAAIIAPITGDNDMLATGKVHYKLIGSAPNRILAVEWLNIRLPGDDANPTTGTASLVQATLSETTGVIVYRYGAMVNNSTTSQARSVAFSSGLGTAAGLVGAVTTITGTPAYTATGVTLYATTSFTASAAMTNLNSTNNTTRRVFTFTPNATPSAAPTNLTFTSIGASSLALNWTDNATNEVAYSIYRSTDNVNFTFAGETAANVTSFTDMGLTPATLYYYQVRATAEAKQSASLTGSVTTIAPAPLNGLYTINQTGSGSNNFASFTLAINALNDKGISGAVTFNVAAGQTFAENPPAITATGTVANPIVFQKTTGTNPVLQVTTGAAAIDIAGGDYFTFMGIDVSAGATGPIYGYRIRNATATNGAFNNTVQDARITLDRTTSTSGAGLIQTSNFIGGGVDASAGSGLNQNNRYLNLAIFNAYNGIWLYGTSTAAADLNTEVAYCTVGNPAVPGDIGNGNGTTATTAYGIRSVLQNKQSIHDNTVTNVCATTTVYGISIEDSYGTGANSGKFFNNRVSGVRNNTSTTSSTTVAYGIRADVVTTVGTHTLNIYNNFIWNITHGRTGTTATATRIIRGLYLQSVGNGSGSAINVYFNSISIDGSGSPSGSNTCLEIATTSGPVYNIRNNVFANITGAQTGGKHYTFVSSSSTLVGAAGSVSNYNDLYVAGGTGDATHGYVGAMGAPSTTVPSTSDQSMLTDWRMANSQDANSSSTDPLFTSATDLHLLATSPAKGAGQAIASYTTDIDGDTRKAIPDLGGDEIPASGTDVATSTLNGPTTGFAPGAMPVTISIANVGLSTISTVDVSYVLNGATTNLGTITLPTPLASGASTIVALGSLTFIDDVNTLSAMATTVGDADASNDTKGPLSYRPALSGAYTIDNTQPTAAHNFASFTDAAAVLNTAGVRGAVTFAVSNGPYNEQISLDPIAGASATNTIVFDGNGRTIQFGSNDSDQRAVIRLNGTDFVTFDNLLIDTTVGGTSATTYGWGVQLINAADYNRILNSTIICTVASTSVGYAGIVASGSNSSPTTAGDAANFLTVQGNTVVGGYYGIILNGSSAAALAGAHQIRNNTIRDFYTYGIDVESNNGVQIIGNDIHRATRTAAVSSFLGIYITGGTINADIEKNRLHDTFTATSSTSGAEYGIYFSANDATTTTANDVVNNLLYNFNSPSGLEYGLYNTDSDYVRYYHNTVVLNTVSASTTSTTAGFYQLTAATGIELRNNLFSVTRNAAGTGSKYALAFGTATSTIASNYNNLHIGTGTNFYTGLKASTYATLANWRTGSGQDANSAQLDPGFDAAFKPSLVALDNLGVPLARVTDDLAAAPRSATTPDMGAYEFTGAACGTVLNLTATNLKATSADLTFNPGGSNTSFIVMVNDGTTTTTVTPSPTASPVLLTGLLPGTEYTATVTADCGGGQTSPAATVIFTTRVANDECADAILLTPGAAGAGCTTPTSGTTLNATSTLAATPCTGTADDDVFYSFVATTTQHSIVMNEGTGFDGVIDLRSGTCSGTNLLCQDLTASGGVETMVATGLTVGGTYLVRVYSFSATAPTASNSSFTICITTPAACDVPTTVAVNTIALTSANVTFAAGFGATFYTVTATPASGPVVTATGLGSPIALTGLTSDTQYSVAVTSNCGGGATATSAPAVSFNTLITNDDPSGAIAVALTADCTSVTYGTNAGAGTTTANGYANPGTASNSCGIATSPKDVWYTFTTPATGAGSVIITVTGNPAGQIRAFSSASGTAGPFTQIGCSASGAANMVAPPLTLSGLAASTTYFVRVAGYSTTDTQGAFTLCITTPPVSCGAHTLLAVANITQTSADVTFTAGLGNTSFTAMAMPQSGGATITGTGTGSPITLTGLTAGLTYDLSLQAVCAAGGTTPAVTTTFSTPATCTLTTWTGATSDSWFASTNWSSCVPSAGTDAVIPAGLARYPSLTTGTADVRTLTLANGASLHQSAGTLNVYGDLTSSTPAANVSLTGGTVAFRGVTPTVTGPLTLYDLTVSLTAPAGILALNASSTVTHTLTMTQGVLTTGTFVLTLPTAATISETNTSYVLGHVAVPGRSLATATAETFGGIGLTLTPDAASAVFPGPTTVFRTTGTALTGAGTSTSITRYFDIQPTVNTGLNVALDFAYFDHERNGIAPSNLVLFKSVNGPAGPWANQSPVTTPGNLVRKTGITDFSIWTLGSIAAPLPVVLTTFTAERQGTDAALTWTTASEQNNRGFEVQSSADGREFRTLDFVAGAGSSTVLHRYAFADHEAGTAGRRYYRLRLLDLSGAMTYSPIRSVRFDNESLTGSFTASPNPFAGGFMLGLQARTAQAAVKVTLLDATGRQVYQGLLDVPAGGSQLPVAGLEGLPAGMYLLNLTLDGQALRLKMIKN